MDSQPSSLADILSALARGATVITSNQRAARTLRTLYTQHQQASGQHTWQSPSLLPWDAWTASLWQKLLQSGTEDRLLLNSIQEQHLWAEIIAADDTLATLRSTESLASLAAGAFTLLSRYGGRDQLKRAANTAETQAFANWADRFERRCRTASLLPPSQLEHELQLAIEKSHLKLTTEILLIGFESLTPAQTNLLHAFQHTGATVSLQDLQTTQPTTENLLTTAPTQQDELRAAAQWARRTLQQSPAARIAILAPSLDDDRTEIDRTFREILAPEQQDIANAAPAPYEFSLGSPLASLPMAAIAIELLRWTIQPLPIQRISSLLLSPYFGNTTAEQNIRAEFDAFILRQSKLLRPELSLRSVINELNKHPHLATTTALLAALQQSASDQGVASTRKQGYGEWMESIRELLRAAQWPGTRTLSSTEFQLRRKWESALDTVATLDFTGDRVPFTEALTALETSLRETRFAPQSHNAPVQIMGVLESAGSLFDAVWFLRGHDAAWPPRPRPHPLLPWQLQRKLSMPGADIAQSQQQARAIVQRIRHSAPQIIFSFAEQGADGPQRRSSLIAELGWPQQPAILEAPAPAIIETQLVPDTDPLPALPDRVLRGGESVLRLQAACGFRAFAERRLWATELDTIAIGLDASQWGNLVHDVIRRFWAEVKTQANLRALPEAARTTLLATCIHAALRHTPAPDTPWDEAYLETQQQRLRSLLSAWFEFELSRKPFAVNLSEKSFDDISVGPLRLGMRIDRVDQVEGGIVLIDYKTGRAGIPGWQGERPDDPQLPLYATFAASGQHLEAIAFARLRTGNQMKLEGYDAGNNAIPRPAKLKTATLDEQLDQWRNILIHLAEDFAAGITDVEPKQYPNTCKYCAQRLLCRLDVSTLQLLDDSEDEAEDTDG